MIMNFYKSLSNNLNLNFMENSFYYFFSAVPQVLGAILALFGVFVIFKIDLIKNQLLGVGKALIEKISTIVSNSKEGITDIVFRPTKIELDLMSNQIKALESYIEKQDIEGLKEYIYHIDYDDYSILIDKYRNLFNFRKDLIKRTIRSVIYTSVVIILSLFSLTLGSFIENQPCILFPLFFVFIVLIILSFRLFFSILKDSLK
jgi:hypothetical protein